MLYSIKTIIRLRLMNKDSPCTAWNTYALKLSKSVVVVAVWSLDDFHGKGEMAPMPLSAMRASHEKQFGFSQT